MAEEKIKIKIEKNIPIPKSMWDGISEQLDIMEVGDSFFLPATKENTVHTLRLSVRRHFNKKGWEYVSRSVISGGEVGVRIWRTK